MKKLISILAILAFMAPALGQSKKKSGVYAKQAVTQNTLGVCLGYYVVFQNDSKRSVDGIRWKATFENNFGERIKTVEGQWQSGNFISPIKPGESAKEIEECLAKGATKVFIEITEVHFEK